MTGPFAGRFPNREWVRQTNLQLNAIGFGDIDPCENRTKGRSYAYMADCDGRLKIVSDMYAAAAFVAGLHPEPEVAEDLPQRGRVPDIVDSTVPLRLQTYGGLFNGSANGATQINTSISGLDSQTALNDPVPFTASRSAIPHLLPQPGMMVADPLPQVAGAGPLQRNHRSSPPAPAPSHQARPQVVQVDSIEKVERPRITDYLPAPADSSRTPAKSTESGGRPAFSPI
ncbi:hypothetical protein ACFONL_11505 [Camelimonas fluminis]|uniref:Uncharacterized protein n=1 Tax=Camelimonas fluminis TaxID=1576911 RepID=A0ABV7UH05_9HYPH|nr:hypothetical protein [Camelimonas fluminis]